MVIFSLEWFSIVLAASLESLQIQLVFFSVTRRVPRELPITFFLCFFAFFCGDWGGTYGSDQ